MKKGSSLPRVLISGAALLGWLLCFSSGLLIDSEKYRRFLAPELYAAQQKPVETVKIPTAVFDGSSATAFFKAMFCFTPTNLLFLTLFAGLLGGCSSNVVAEGLGDMPSKEVDARRLMYLEENPWSAMMRSFIVYLCVIAGLYFIIDDPFKSPTPAQYMRLAGTLSILAFVVGYDPSRIEQWIGLIPNPQPTQVVTVRDDRSGVQMTAAQGSLVARATADEHSQAVVLPANSRGDAAQVSSKTRRSAK